MKKTLFIAILLLILAGTTIYSVKLFRTPHTAPLTIILSPHFDDGVLSLGGLLAKRENEALVATFFTKRPTAVMHTQWDKISGFADSDEAILARTKENENALLPFGAIIKNYDYPDFQYRKENQDKEIRKNIAGDIAALLNNYGDREIYIYGPATFGLTITHPDHQLVHDAFMDAWRENKRARTHFLIYEDFPYARRFSLSNLGNLNAYLEKTENMKFAEKPIELNKTELSEKITAIYAHPSQVKAFRSFGGDIGILAEKFFQERCRALLPRAYACEVAHLAS